MLSRVFKAFQYRDFRLMWMGACTSSIGTWMQKLAQSWLVLEISKNPFLLGLDAFLGEIPIFLFSLLGGVVADRFDRRFLLIGSQIVQMSCAFLLAALFAFGTVQVWHILTLSFIVGLAQAFGGPGLSGADSHAGASGRSVERHRAELDSVQPGARDRADDRRVWR